MVGNGYTENSCRYTNPIRNYPGTCNCLRCILIFPTVIRELLFFCRNFLSTTIVVVIFDFRFKLPQKMTYIKQCWEGKNFFHRNEAWNEFLFKHRNGIEFLFMKNLNENFRSSYILTKKIKKIAWPKFLVVFLTKNG